MIIRPILGFVLLQNFQDALKFSFLEATLLQVPFAKDTGGFNKILRTIRSSYFEVSWNEWLCSHCAQHDFR